jgi:hypothetical protein
MENYFTIRNYLIKNQDLLSKYSESALAFLDTLVGKILLMNWRKIINSVT